MTPLDRTLKRTLSIKGVDYVVTLSPESLKLTRKGRRLGMELRWADITSGESALAVALHASIGRFDSDEKPRAKSAQLLKNKIAGAKSVRTSTRRVARNAPTKRSR
jgi:hypothetical protein